MSAINVRTETVFELRNWGEGVGVDDVTPRLGLAPLAAVGGGGGGGEIKTLVRDGLTPREMIPDDLFGD